MKIKRRQFNELLAGTSLISLFPFNSFADNYTGPVNWAGTSFLVPFNEIKTLMPITKSASEISSDTDNASFFNSSLNKYLREKPLTGINLKLEGFAENAKLALTYGFAAEFDFGEFKDTELQKTSYLTYSFGQCLLYDVYARIIVSSVPVRAISTHLISYEEEKKYSNIKAELMKRAFYNKITPEETMVDQFRLMVQKQSFEKKEWKAKKFRVGVVSLPDDTSDLFKNFGLTKNQFLDFLGQSSSFAFAYKLNSPILPFMMNASLTNTTISRFDFATKLYNKIDVKLPSTDFELKIYHQGWEFVEENNQQNAKSILEVSLGMALEIKIYDTFEKIIIYNQYFFGETKYEENKNSLMRSNASKVCELTEGILERAFLSIKDKDYRKKIIEGDAFGSRLTSSFVQIDTDKPEEVSKQSELVLKKLPQVNSF